MDEFRQESNRSGFEQKSTAAISHEDTSSNDVMNVHLNITLYGCSWGKRLTILTRPFRYCFNTIRNSHSGTFHKYMF